MTPSYGEPDNVLLASFSKSHLDFHRDIEYSRTDAFIEKARKWFEKQNEWHDLNGNRHCDLNDFEDFVNYMKGE